jgi:hypothetical protein
MVRKMKLSDYTTQWKGKCGYQIKQTNGKENVFTPKNWKYILPNEKRSMIYMIGQQVQRYLDKGAREES